MRKDDDLFGPGGQIAPGVRLRTLINLRWAAIAGQAAALIIVDAVLNFPLAVLPTWATVGALAALNIFLLLRYPRGQQLTGRQASVQLGFDLVQLATLLYLTGGLENPFSVLILVPVTISATILSARSTLALLVLAFLCLVFLALYHLPLPWGSEPLSLSPTFLLGVAFALTIAMAFVAIYAWRVSDDARRRAQALVATQNALAREQKLSALGSLAAAAAHELGTPLGTITLVTKELLRERAGDDALMDELKLLESQATRCRDILANLSRRAEAEDQHFKRAPITAIIREAAKPYEDMGPKLYFTATSTDDGPTPVIPRRSEILHGLGNYIENACRHAKARVSLDLSWDHDEVHLVISDDGSGFDPDILDVLGEPYLPSRAGGMGLGIFIAATLLERTGAAIIYVNDVSGGAVVDITWPRSAIEEKGETWEAL